MIIEVETNPEVERLVAILSLGLCAAIETNCLSSEEAERYLFSPHSINLLQTVRASPKLVEIVDLGTEIGICERHFPDIVESSLSTIKSSALSVLQSLPRSSEPKQHWLQLGGRICQENSIRGAMLSLLDELDAVYLQHEEATSDNVGEQMYEAVHQSFLDPVLNYTLPVEFGMSSAEGNHKVREVLSRFLNRPEVVSAWTQLQTPQERLGAFQDPYVCSAEGVNFTMYFRYRAKP